MSLELFSVAAFAAFLLLAALLLAWVLGITLFYPDGSVAKRLADRGDIIRAHIDYLMMAQFLFLFFAAFRQLSVTPPAFVVVCLCVGAFLNPLGFLMRGLQGRPAEPPKPGFPIFALVTFSAATIGFLAAAWLIVEAAWKTL